MAKSTGNEAKLAREDEQARQERIRQGTTKINDIFDSQFTDNFFNSRKQAYMDYATPQLDDQFGNTTKELVYALDRAGLLDSSTRATKEAELNKTYQLQRQDIADKALASANTERSSIEDARSGLIATLNATGDADQAAKSAITRASALSTPAAYSPLSNLFADFTNTLSTQAALEKANALSGGATGVRYSTGLFAPSNSMSVSR